MADKDRTGVTILDVAAAAGVSRQTVSNVINAPARVTAATAARVRQVIEELGYRPNRAARSLRERASKLLGFRVDAPHGLSNLLDRFLHALTEAASGAGYHVLLFTPSCIDEELATYEDLIRTGTVDGFVLANVGVDDQRPAWFAHRRIPYVCFGRPWQREPNAFPWVDVDGAAGTGLAVDHLVGRGHRRIAYLGWPAGTGWGDDREAGWRTAMERHRLPIEGLFGACPEDAASASAVAAALLDGPSPPTGFVCGSDTFAVAARLAGGHDPAGRPRVEVVGFDDSPAAQLLSPPLSTVRQPLDEVARHVVDLLLSALRESGRPAAPPGGGTLLRPDLVVREPPETHPAGGCPAGGLTK